jgi:hypothetical protein
VTPFRGAPGDARNVRFGSFATLPAGVAYRLVSAFAPKATQLLRAREMTRWARNGLIAHAVEGGITERRPWYDPSEKLPDRPIIDAEMNVEFETLIVDIPSAQNPAVRGSKDGATIGMPSPAA